MAIEISGAAEKHLVARHRVIHPRTRQNQPVVAAKSGDQDQRRHYSGTDRPEYRFHHRAGDTVLCRELDSSLHDGSTVRHALHRQNIQIRDVREQVEQADEASPVDQRTRKIPLRRVHFSRSERDVHVDGLPRRYDDLLPRLQRLWFARHGRCDRSDVALHDDGCLACSGSRYRHSHGDRLAPMEIC